MEWLIGGWLKINNTILTKANKDNERLQHILSGSSVKWADRYIFNGIHYGTQAD